MDAQQKHHLMTTAPVEGLICRLAVPSIMTMLISALYNMADTYFVGGLGTSAIAGVGVVFPLMNIIQAVGFFFGQGGGNNVSRSLGAQDIELAERTAATAFFSSFFGGGMILALGTIFKREFVSLLGATPTIAPYAIEYMTYILFAAPLMTSSLFINTLLRFQGSSFFGMLGMVSGALLNIALDPIFIFALDLGVAGASIATMISQCVGFAVLLHGCGRHGNLSLKFSRFTPSIDQFVRIVRGGVPSLCRQSIASIATICVNRYAGAFGDAAIAAMSIVQRVFMFANSALIGFGQGFQPVVGFNYGARMYDRVLRGFSFTVRVTTIFLAIVAALGWIFAPEVIAIFRADDPGVMDVGVFALRALCVPMALHGLIVMTNMMVQTIGYASRATLIALSRQGLFLIPALAIMTPRLGLLGVELAQPISDVSAFVLSAVMVAPVIRGMKRRVADAGEEKI